ncbi:ABC transporter substrate-binding protein, partial [Streptomyces sp. NPDC087850]
MSTSGAGQPPGPVPATRTTRGTGSGAVGGGTGGTDPGGAAAAAAGGRPPVQRTGGEPALPAPRPYDFGVLHLPELRALRRESRRDEADLSYLRRLFQGRIDIL